MYNSSGLFFGGPWGRLLSGQCIHRRAAANAGNNPLFVHVCYTLPSKMFVSRFHLLDARGGGILCVREVDAGLQITRALQTQHGWTGTLHVPVWVYDSGRENWNCFLFYVAKYSVFLFLIFIIYNKQLALVNVNVREANIFFSLFYALFFT